MQDSDNLEIENVSEDSQEYLYDGLTEYTYILDGNILLGIHHLLTLEGSY